MRSTRWRGRRWPVRTPSTADLRTVKVVVCNHLKKKNTSLALVHTGHSCVTFLNAVAAFLLFQCLLIPHCILTGKNVIETNVVVENVYDIWTFFSHPLATSGVSAGEEKGCYLASGSKDQTVRIWSSAKGKGKRFRRGRPASMS